jgi:uncharacterized membrane protein HdeD (DUF308 family)
MPSGDLLPRQSNLKNYIQIIAGLVFIILGCIILFNKFENNAVLVGPKKTLFGAIVCAYGLLKWIRIFMAWKTKKNYYYEHKD